MRSVLLQIDGFLSNENSSCRVRRLVSGKATVAATSGLSLGNAMHIRLTYLLLIIYIYNDTRLEMVCQWPACLTPVAERLALVLAVLWELKPSDFIPSYNPSFLVVYFNDIQCQSPCLLPAVKNSG